MVENYWLIQIWLFLYFLALRASSFHLELMESFHGLALAPYTSLMDMWSLTFDIALPLYVFHDEEERGTLPLLAKCFSNLCAIPKHSVLWRCVSQTRYLFVVVRAKVSLEIYSLYLLSR